MAFTVRDWLNNPRPTMTTPEAFNPPSPLPSWEITGTPPPALAHYTAAQWDASSKAYTPGYGLLSRPANSAE
jgi:hypothetical protein